MFFFFVSGGEDIDVHLTWRRVNYFIIGRLLTLSTLEG